MGVTDFIWRGHARKKTPNPGKSEFVSEEGHSGCKSQNIAIRALKGNVLRHIWFKCIEGDSLARKVSQPGEVPQRTSSHLASIVSRALQPQDGRMSSPVNRNPEFF